MATVEDILIFEIGGIAHEIVLDGTQCPRTLEAVKKSLPAQIDVHCAKIAGSHIMWPVPFVERVETASDVLRMPAGAFFFWPERQYLEITYAPLQAEEAAVNYLGQVRGDIAWLRDYADLQRRKQGQEIFKANVYLAGRKDELPPNEASIAKVSNLWKQVLDARRDAWANQPADVERLLSRRGLNIPYGPLSMAEGELRKLHELLWRLWNEGSSRSDAEKSKIACFVLEAAITRVGGFCHMSDTGAVLKLLIQCLRDEVAPVESVLREGILYVGRMAAWLDLYIQWWPINELTLKSLETVEGNR